MVKRRSAGTQAADMEPRNKRIRWGRPARAPGKATERHGAMSDASAPHPGSETGACVDQLSAREPGDLRPAPHENDSEEPRGEAQKRNPKMDRTEESDRLVVPEKEANAGPKRGAAGGNEPGQGERVEDHPRRTQGRRIDGKSGLRRVSEKANEEAKKPRKDKEKFTNLLTHLRVDLLREVFFRLKRNAAPGVDGMTWSEYECGLEERLCDLQARLHRWAYRPQPVRRTYIPKADGKQRPLGIPAIEDKIVQGAVVSILTPIYEAEFLDCSYGFRPKRNQHMALEAIDAMIMWSKVNWVLDGDIKAYFDTIEHDWMLRMLEHRIGDHRLIRLIRKWLKAGVMEDDTLKETDEGSPQGGLISPLLANIYLHYALDLWFTREARGLRGRAHLVRYADDFLIGFEYESEARMMRAQLETRLKEFGLTLHPEKTKVIRFGRFAERDCGLKGEGDPPTFDFLGFTHISGKNRKGGFQLVRRTAKKKRVAKLKALKMEMQKRMHWRIADQWRWLCSVLKGHFNYYSVPTNYPALASFLRSVRSMWFRTLQRRSQRARKTRAALTAIERRFPFPRPRILIRPRQLALSLRT